MCSNEYLKKRKSDRGWVPPEFFSQIPAINPIYHVVYINFPSVLILNTGESESEEKKIIKKYEFSFKLVGVKNNKLIKSDVNKLIN